ncbi:hypothetical protein EON80_02200 [bacterium]|nr:MAG: hypothetical protein EON80_02200 [bacterium]
MKFTSRKSVQFSKSRAYQKRGSLLFFALMGGLIAAPQAEANFREKAVESTSFIQRTMYDSKAGLYHPGIPLDPKALPYEFMWGNGVQFTVLAAAATQDPAAYRQVLDAFYNGLEKHWDLNPEPFDVPGYDAYFASKDGNDKYYDDNAWLILGMAEAYRGTKDPKFLKKARECFDFILSGWDEKLGGGIYWYQKTRDGKNTCINAPGAAGALALYEIEKKPSDLEWAKKLYDWTQKNLQDTDGLYWDNINLDGKIEKTKWTYNSALMIRSAIGLWRATGDKKYWNDARKVADASLIRFINPASGAMSDTARFNHLLSESLLVAYEATKDIRYLNAVRRHADFGYRYVRDVTDGGYWNKWDAVTRPPGEEKTLIENASAARLFWLLTAYPDVEELRDMAQKATERGDNISAASYIQQAFNSTAGAEPTHPPEEAKAKK